MLDLLGHVGLEPVDLLETTEYCVVDAIPQYRVVAPVRERRLSPPWPASTGALCQGPGAAGAAARGVPQRAVPGGGVSLLTDEIRSLVGTTRVYTAPEPFGRVAGRYFAIATGDRNPLYTDDEAARAAGLPGVTVPPTLVCETNQYADLPRDAEGYAGHTWRLDIPGTRQVRGGNRYTFHRRIRPDDVVTATWEITRVEEKQSRSGADMLVVHSKATYTAADGGPLAENEETIIFVALEGAS
ncbi:MaoC family dehydratase N-terminal domain-containing protein [Nocardioides sp. TF02-7]|nr:MaoC family dehydratase N-terminal domain-containing protein [Nocardioides sp. TF02-7]UMG94704.1 MaoC family dehydratase N-terminal domain-containing protein [Nocardioides sp. TF02-7]